MLNCKQAKITLFAVLKPSYLLLFTVLLWHKSFLYGVGWVRTCYFNSRNLTVIWVGKLPFCLIIYRVSQKYSIIWFWYILSKNVQIKAIRHFVHIICKKHFMPSHFEWWRHDIFLNEMGMVFLVIYLLLIISRFLPGKINWLLVFRCESQKLKFLLQVNVKTNLINER